MALMCISIVHIAQHSSCEKCTYAREKALAPLEGSNSKDRRVHLELGQFNLFN